MTTAYILIGLVSLILLFWLKNVGKDQLAAFVVTVWATFVGVFVSVQTSLYVEQAKENGSYVRYLENVVFHSPSARLTNKEPTEYNEKTGNISAELLNKAVAKAYLREIEDYDYSDTGRERFAKKLEALSKQNPVVTADDAKVLAEDVTAFFEALRQLLRSDSHIKSGSRSTKDFANRILREYDKTWKSVVESPAAFTKPLARESVRRLIKRAEHVVICEILIVEGAVSRDDGDVGVAVAGLGFETSGMSFNVVIEKVMDRLTKTRSRFGK